MIKFHQQYFIESILYDIVNREKIRQNNNCYNKINGIENKLTLFQMHPETELACKYKNPRYKTQNSEIFVEYEKCFDMNKGKLIINPNPTHYISNHDENSYIPVTFLENTGKTGGNYFPQEKNSTRLQELSLMNNIYFGVINT